MIRKTVIGVISVVGAFVASGWAFYTWRIHRLASPSDIHAFWACLVLLIVIVVIDAWAFWHFLRGHFRRRRIYKVIALSLCLLSFGAWQYSVYAWTGFYTSSGTEVLFENGCVKVWLGDPLPPSGLVFASSVGCCSTSYSWRSANWFPQVRRLSLRTTKMIMIRIPVWPVFAVCLLTTIVLFRRYRGFPTGLCQNCGYDLTGNVSGVCSECGRKVEG